MDWNKAATILISAFIILNVFLFSSSYNNVFSENFNANSDEQFMGNLENVLKEKGISIKCKLPEETYLLPILSTEYEIVDVNEKLLSRFLGPGIEPVQDVTRYSNENGEILEILDGKKLHYTVREKIDGQPNEEGVAEKISTFADDKAIDMEGYSEIYRHVEAGHLLVAYAKNYNNFSVDNSYIHFYFDAEGIYKFEMQNIVYVKETAERIRTFSAAEALPRLLSFNDMENKEITDVKMTYYSVEDENWKVISGINSYPVWKVIFSDGTQKHLSIKNTYDID